jgi:hypothetical protein
MRTAVWIPRVSLAASLLAMLAVGSRAQAADASCPGPGPLDKPGVSTWTGPPSNDGSLDDGYVPVFDGGGNILDYLMVRPSTPLPTPYSYTVVQAPYADAAGCMAFDAQGHPNAHNCLCQNCFTLIQQCDALPGCQAMMKCGGDSGCTDANSCYLYPGAPCTAVIDQYGNGSVSAGLFASIGPCRTAASCPVK